LLADSTNFGSRRVVAVYADILIDLHAIHIDPVTMLQLK
jgi:hypothetical protein